MRVIEIRVDKEMVKKDRLKIRYQRRRIRIKLRMFKKNSKELRQRLMEIKAIWKMEKEKNNSNRIK